MKTLTDIRIDKVRDATDFATLMRLAVVLGVEQTSSIVFKTGDTPERVAAGLRELADHIDPQTKEKA